MAGPIYGSSTCPLDVARRRPAREQLELAELVVLIVVPKVSGTTRRFSLAMGTPGARRGLVRSIRRPGLSARKRRIERADAGAEGVPPLAVGLRHPENNLPLPAGSSPPGSTGDCGTSAGQSQ
jgi:hypothetical protein